MNVSELMKILESHDPDAPVYYTWEGIGDVLEERGIYLAKGGAVIFDCDQNYYKHRHQQKTPKWIREV